MKLWEDDRQKPRGQYVVPCLLEDTQTDVVVKAVLLDLSAEGCRVFTNDRRVRHMSDELLHGRSFRLDFDFYDVETKGITGEVVNVHPGLDPRQERQLGIRFTAIDPIAKRDINRLVHRDKKQTRKDSA